MIVHHQVVSDLLDSLDDLNTLLETEVDQSNTALTKSYTDAKLYSFLWCLDIMHAVLVDIYWMNVGGDEERARQIPKEDLVNGLIAKKIFQKEFAEPLQILMRLPELLSHDRAFLDEESAYFFDKGLRDMALFKQFMSGLAREIVVNFEPYDYDMEEVTDD